MKYYKYPFFKGIYWICVVGIFIYLSIRAFLVPLVHDEAATFFYYIQPAKFLPFLSHWDANNHILNSALSIQFYKIFGHKDWAIRIPSLLSFFVYAIYSWKIIQWLKSEFLKYMLFFALFFAHYYMEFFALSRGYGLSMAFLVTALYHSYQFFTHKKIAHAWLAMCFIFLATAANLTLFNTYFLLSVSFIFFVVINRGSFSTKNKIYFSTIILFFSLIPLLFWAYYGYELKTRDLLYYGGLSGFWEMSVQTLLLYFIGEYTISQYILLILLGLLIIYSFVYYKKSFILKNIFLEQNHFFNYLLWGNISITLVLGYLFSTNFPEDRTGLYFYPLFVLSFVFILDVLHIKPLQKALSSSVFIFFPIYFFYSINFTHSTFWFMERMPKEFMQKISNVEKISSKIPTLGGYFSDELVWAFYSEKQNTQAIVQHSDFQTNIADYAIYRNARNQVIPKNYQIVIYDSISKKSLLQRINPLKKEMVFHKQKIFSSFQTHQEFFEFFRTDSIPQNLFMHPMAIEFIFTIETPNSYLPSFLVYSATDTLGNNIAYERILLHAQSENMKHKKIHHIMYTPAIQNNIKDIVVYLWNINKDLFSITHGEIKIYSLLDDDTVEY